MKDRTNNRRTAALLSKTVDKTLALRNKRFYRDSELEKLLTEIRFYADLLKY